MRDLILQLSKSSIYSTKPVKSLKRKCRPVTITVRLTGGGAVLFFMMGIHLPEKNVFVFMALMPKEIHLD
jgi:hypothetical protein